jgi:hypothetical protein
VDEARSNFRVVFTSETLVVYRPGVDATGGKMGVGDPFSLTSRMKPRVFYPGERESILHSGSADGSTALPLRLSQRANGFSFISTLAWRELTKLQISLAIRDCLMFSFQLLLIYCNKVHN